LPPQEVAQFCPACGGVLAQTPPLSPASAPTVAAEGYGRDWSALIAGAVVFVIGGLVALIGVENSDKALLVGLAICAFVVAGAVLTNGYYTHGKPITVRAIAMLPEWTLAGIFLVIARIAIRKALPRDDV
jgi:hypothetical protein